MIAQFYNWEGCAKIAEKKTNAILDGEDVPTPKSSEEFIEETVAKCKLYPYFTSAFFSKLLFLVLQKAGTHMEFTFLASYIVMLIGFLIMEKLDWQTFVRQFLKGSNFADMVELLKKFFNFMSLTASVSLFILYKFTF